jgi:hypothetical protein
MANRKNTFLIKRSNIAGKVPAAGDLLLGELALNTADNILYASGTTAGSILPIGWDRVARTGDTMTGSLFSPSISATTISATTYLNLPSFADDYLPLSGGTVYGPTIYTGGLTANTLNVTGLTQTSGITSTGGIILPQKNVTSSYTATTADYFLTVTGGTLDITLMSAVSVQGKLLVIKNEDGGIVNVISQVGETIDDRTDVLLTKGNSVQLISDGVNWVILGYNISSTQANTGVIEFSGLSKVSSSTFYVAPLKGFIVDDVTNPVIPFLTYVEYTGGTHTDNYVNTAFETFVYITSGGTIEQQPTTLTPTQRRQNIFLGKLGHPDKTAINLVFSQPDYVLTPLGQLRDMFIPINLINGGVYPSANTGLTINNSAGYIYGLGINFSSDELSPNSFYVSGGSPTTFQYRTQTGGTITNTTFIDPLNYDLNGVITPLSGSKATNQRVYLLQNGSIRVMYGQHVYSNFAEAVQNIQIETFTPFPNFINNAVLISIITVLSTATDLTDTSKAQFFFTSKFGETVGSAGGVSTTTLQQAYNNSSNPEIVINATLDGLTIKNGTGNADNITRLLEGQTAANGVTSFIRADGYISGTTFQSNGFIANSNGLTATTVSATTYYNLPTDVRVTGGTYSTGTATFTNNTGGTFTVTGFSNGGGGTFTGGTVTGSTSFTSGLSANTISATTYYNLPIDIRVTGGTYTNGTTTFTNNSGGTFSVSGFSTGSTSSLATNNIWIGDATNTPVARTMTGDINISISGVTTIQPNVVTYSKMQTVSTNAFLGSTSVSGGTVEEIPMVDAYITTGAAYTLLTTSSNWDIDGVYIGTSITGTFQGQSAYDGNYWFTAVDDNLWIRLIRG